MEVKEQCKGEIHKMQLMLLKIDGQAKLLEQGFTSQQVDEILPLI